MERPGLSKASSSQSSGAVRRPATSGGRLREMALRCPDIAHTLLELDDLIQATGKTASVDETDVLQVQRLQTTSHPLMTSMSTPSLHTGSSVSRNPSVSKLNASFGREQAKSVGDLSRIKSGDLRSKPGEKPSPMDKYLKTAKRPEPAPTVPSAASSFASQSPRSSAYPMRRPTTISFLEPKKLPPPLPWVR